MYTTRVITFDAESLGRGVRGKEIGNLPDMDRSALLIRNALPLSGAAGAALITLYCGASHLSFIDEHAHPPAPYYSIIRHMISRRRRAGGEQLILRPVSGKIEYPDHAEPGLGYQIPDI